jgi:hypothetical protein
MTAGNELNAIYRFLPSLFFPTISRYVNTKISFSLGMMHHNHPYDPRITDTFSCRYLHIKLHQSDKTLCRILTNSLSHYSRMLLS